VGLRAAPIFGCVREIPRFVVVVVVVDVVVDGDGDVNDLPEKSRHTSPSPSHVAVKVNDNVNVNDHVQTRLLLALEEDPETLQGEVIVHLLDGLGFGFEEPRFAAGGEHGARIADLRLEPGHDPIDQSDISVDQA
jgi:hypothetical protein